MKFEDVIEGFDCVEFQRRVREASSRAELAEPEAYLLQVREAYQRYVAGKSRRAPGAPPRAPEYGK